MRKHVESKFKIAPLCPYYLGDKFGVTNGACRLLVGLVADGSCRIADQRNLAAFLRDKKTCESTCPLVFDGGAVDLRGRRFHASGRVGWLE